MTSLTMRPRNWRYHYPFVFENEAENMRVWSANDMWGLDFKIEGRQYGGITLGFMNLYKPWRHQMWKVIKEAMENPWIEKYGWTWENENSK